MRIAKEADLHLHSYNSDGADSVTELVDKLRSEQVGVAAFTDHHTTAAIRDPVVRAYLEQLGDKAPRIIPGIEIDTALPQELHAAFGDEVHIIGLGVNPFDTPLRKAMLQVRNAKAKRLNALFKTLKQRYPEVMPSIYNNVRPGSQLSKWQAAEALARIGAADSQRQAYKEIIKPIWNELATAIPVPTLTPDQVIALIQQSGGVAILAHPHEYMDSIESPQLLQLLSHLKAAGLDGVEVHRSEIDQSQQDVVAHCAEQTGLLVSGGSDYHNPDYTPHGVGGADVPLETVSAIDQLIKSRGGYVNLMEVPLPEHPAANAYERFRF